MSAGSECRLSRPSPAGGYAAGLLGPMLLRGLGVDLGLMPLNATTLTGIQPREAGSAAGLLRTLRWLGGGTRGLSVLVTVYGTATRHATGSPHTVLAEGATSAFLAGALITVCTVPVAALMIKGRRPARN
ncbi:MULTISPECIES: hypothetical protein [unclassified Streptomyces]|uniref:hypothetical protein n=2 Tax=unclassified Streptomyces TaxID=2593676 RepID=UPI002B1CB28A|nr:hypothetical protein [Streptomyces sp. NBC_01500]